MADKLSKDEVNYRHGARNKHCGNCSMYRKPHRCTLVEGRISTDAVCDRWDKLNGSRAA